MKSISEVIPGIRNPTEFGTLSTIILKKKKKNTSEELRKMC